jgi:N-methylhydantoinase A/oxoprolinase/acetone carboxylase beta subunit
MKWSGEATEMMEQLLQELPLPVREGVQQAAELRAEALAEKQSAAEVSVELAVAAFIESTPADLRERLKHTLSYRGLDPEDYEAAFSS